MHIMTDRGWELIGGPLAPMKPPTRDWNFSSYNPGIVRQCLDPKSSAMNANLVRAFERISPSRFMGEVDKSFDPHIEIETKY